MTVSCISIRNILLFRELTEIEDALRTSSLTLTPHMMSPLQDGKEPSDITIMKSGVYNLGFVGVANDRDGKALLRWWADRLYAHCRVDIANHMFTDQRWMDLSPAFVERVTIIRHPGYNVAYWNPARAERDAVGRGRLAGSTARIWHSSTSAVSRSMTQRPSLSIRTDTILKILGK